MVIFKFFPIFNYAIENYSLSINFFKKMKETKKHLCYIYQILKLVLAVLPVSTVTTERWFLTSKIAKTYLRDCIGMSTFF